MDLSEIDFFITEAKRTPLLTREEEVELARIIQKGGPESAAATDRFIRANLRLVIPIATLYARRCPEMSLMDIIQEGNIGLMRAVGGFDPERGFKFSTYASWWIKQACMRATIHAREIRVPIHKMDLFHRYQRERQALTRDLGSEPTLEMLAERLGIPPVAVVELQNIPVVSGTIHDPLGESGLTLLDILEDTSEATAEDLTVGKLFSVRVTDLVARLSPREQSFLHRYYGEGVSLEQIGKDVGLTRERVRQVILRALNTLRRKLKRDT